MTWMLFIMMLFPWVDWGRMVCTYEVEPDGTPVQVCVSVPTPGRAR